MHPTLVNTTHSTHNSQAQRLASLLAKAGPIVALAGVITAYVAEALGARLGLLVFGLAVVVLGIVQGAYSGEIIRGAIESIPHGQIEAARAYGINRLMLVRRVILPSMLPFAIAGLSNLWLVLVKESALISVVGYSELLTAGRQAAASTKHYLLFYLAVAAFYYLITLVSSSVFRQVEVRFERWMPRHS